MSQVADKAMVNIDWAAVRQDFPILARSIHGKPLVYLDNAATSQKPQQVLDVIDRYWTETNANIHRGVHYLSQKATAQYDDSREAVRRLLGAKHAHEVILTKGCTEGINLVAQSYARNTLKPGDEILVSTMEHHSNIVPWQLVAEQTGAVVRPIPIDDAGDILLDEYQKMLSDRTKIVSVVHVSNSLGTVNPVKEMIRMAHAVGAVVLVDGAQAGPHLRINVQDLDADFYTLSCHKIYAPTGVGALYGKERLLDAMPPYHGGGDMIRSVSFEKTTYAALPAKFEAGTPNIAGVIGLGAAISYLESLALPPDASSGGSKALAPADALTAVFKAIGCREGELMEQAMSALGEIEGVRLTGTAKKKAGIVSFVMDNAHPHDIGTILDNQGIAIRAGHHCCMPLMQRLGVPATARASFAFYNTEEEVERLVAAVRKVKELFA